MRLNLLRLILASALITASAGWAYGQEAADETSMRQAVQNMQEGWNQKKGVLFASAFAEEHDYVVVNGMFLPKMSREENARQHQSLFDGVYKEVDIQLSVNKVRFLSPEFAVLHVRGFSHPKGNTEQKRQEIIISCVMQKKGGQWKIVAFHNSPMQPSQAPPASN